MVLARTPGAEKYNIDDVISYREKDYFRSWFAHTNLLYGNSSKKVCSHTLNRVFFIQKLPDITLLKIFQLEKFRQRRRLPVTGDNCCQNNCRSITFLQWKNTIMLDFFLRSAVCVTIHVKHGTRQKRCTVEKRQQFEHQHQKKFRAYLRIWNENTMQRAK